MSSAYFFLRLKRKRLKRKSDIKKSKEPSKIIYNSSNMVQVCRICLKEGKIPIFGDKNEPDISKDIEIFGDINLDMSDFFPKSLCEACHTLLECALLFRKCAKESDKTLHQQLETKTETETAVTEPDTSIYEDNDYQIVDRNQSFFCSTCKLTFKTCKQLRLHKKSKHKNVRIQCRICNKLLTPHFYKAHVSRHETSHFVCEVCGKSYRKYNLMRHLQLHSLELPFKCQTCPYRGRSSESLKNHMRSHSGKKPFACHQCEMRFLTRSNLNRHLLTHNKERPASCVKCRQGFYTKRDLDIHVKSYHVGIKDYECKLCGNKYGTRKALMRHELRVHKRDKMSKGRMPLYLQNEYKKALEENK